MNERKNRWHFSIFRRIMLIIILCVLVTVLFFEIRFYLRTKSNNESKSQKVSNMEKEISEIDEKTQDFIRNKKITEEDYEKVARDELNLINANEIVIKPR